MTFCACGCGRALDVYRRGHRYATNTCAQRHRRRLRPKRPITSADRQRWARESAKSRQVGIVQRLAERFASLDRAAALQAAFILGLRAGYRASARARQLTARAA